MPARNVFGLVESIAEDFFSLATGETVRLARKDARSADLQGLLEEASAAQIPVLIEISDTDEIIEVLVPMPADGVSSVVSLDAATVEVELVRSQKRHQLRRGRPDFAQLRAKLEAALASGTRVFITTTDEDGVVHVEDTHLPFESTMPDAEAEVRTERLKSRESVSPEEAKALFGRVAEVTCDPRNPRSPCITFLFPDDGCYARAHQICHLIGATKTGKAWLYGRLIAKTPNHPDCAVSWRYHVAPTVLVRTTTSVTTYIIDPSLFTGPVPLPTWKGVQGDAGAKIFETDAEPFYRSADGAIQRDPDYTETNQALAAFRLKLRERSLSKGPPPYARCSVMPTEEALT